MSIDPECVFCKIIARTIPSHGVYEDERLVAFLDVGPIAEGHVLVVPRDHVENLADLSEETSGAVGAVLPRIVRGVLKATGAAGLNVLLNQGPVAGQVVPHVHFHLIPRRDGDGLGYRWDAGTYPPGRDAELAALIRDGV